MTRPESCENCSRSHDCKMGYEQPGCVEGPSVTGEVVVAFLLPIVIFVAALGGFGRVLENSVARPYQTPLALGLAIMVTAGSMLATRALVRYRPKTWFRKQQQ